MAESVDQALIAKSDFMKFSFSWIKLEKVCNFMTKAPENWIFLDWIYICTKCAQHHAMHKMNKRPYVWCKGNRIILTLSGLLNDCTKKKKTSPRVENSFDVFRQVNDSMNWCFVIVYLECMIVNGIWYWMNRLNYLISLT